MTELLDSTMLIAAAFEDHVHNAAAERWSRTFAGRFATCPIKQGAVVRSAIRQGFSTSDATEILDRIATNDRHDFWPDAIGYGDVNFRGVVGHRQVTDAYLAQLARHNGGRVATLDEGFAALHNDVADLVPTEEEA